MLNENRINYIKSKLNDKSFVTVVELSQELHLSEVSVRKLLKKMEIDGLLKRSWGGAVNITGSLVEYSHSEKATKNLSEKKAIAAAAYECINDHESIFLDSGTTTIELAKLIANGSKRHVVVCTNAINIAMEFENATDIEVFIVGGLYRHKIKCCVGGATISAIKQLNCDKTFMTGNHFTLDVGYSTPSFQEAEMKRTIVHSGKRKYVLMDSSKYGDNSLCCIEKIDACDCLITDWKISEECRRAFKEKGINIIIAPPVD